MITQGKYANTDARPNLIVYQPELSLIVFL